MSLGDSGVGPAKPRLRCRIGWHRFREIPDDVRARMAKLGCTDPPDWYAGRLVPARCWDCGVPEGQR